MEENIETSNFKALSMNMVLWLDILVHIPLNKMASPSV